MKNDNSINPAKTFIIIAVFRFMKITGIMKISAVMNFVKKVDIVLCHTDFFDFPTDSSEMCIPKASEKASAIAIVIIPPKTASFECVPENSPTINPSVVIIPEVIPNPNPLFIDFFIVRLMKLVIKV